MKINQIAILVFLLGAFLTNCKDDKGEIPNSQSGITFYNETGTEKVHRVINLQDGGFLYVGKANNKAFAMKVDAQGDRSWYETIGEVQGAEFFDAAETESGELICVGITQSDPTSLDKEAGLVVKFSSNGKVVWRKGLPGVYRQGLHAVMSTPDGYIAASGYVVPSDGDTWVVKLTNEGEVEWSRDYDFLSPWHDWGTSMVMSPDGEYVISGVTSPDGTPLNNAKFDAYVIAVGHSDGAFAWGRPYRQFPTVQAPGPDGNPKVIAVDDGYVWAKALFDTDTVLHVQLVKTDFTGAPVFDKKYYGLGTCKFNSIQATDDGGFLINGSSTTLEASTTSQMMLLKVDGSGGEEWYSYSGGKPNVEHTYQSNVHSNVWKHAGSSLNTKGVSSLTLFKTNSEGKINN